MSRITRLLEWVFIVYFLTHIPFTIFINSQALLPMWMYSESLLDLVDWYSLTFKDSMVRGGPAWYRSTIVIELCLQLPFFFVASYAFFKGSQKWIRTPAIVYSTHVTTTVYYMLIEWYFSDFDSNRKFPGPATSEERIRVSLFYWPYFVIPLVLLVTMLTSAEYRQTDPRRQKSKYP